MKYAERQTITACL